MSVSTDLEEAQEKAKKYEDGCDSFDQWLVQAETRLRSREPLSIASQPLTRQEQEIRVTREGFNGGPYKQHASEMGILWD